MACNAKNIALLCDNGSVVIGVDCWCLRSPSNVTVTFTYDQSTKIWDSDYGGNFYRFDPSTCLFGYMLQRLDGSLGGGWLADGIYPWSIQYQDGMLPTGWSRVQCDDEPQPEPGKQLWCLWCNKETGSSAIAWDTPTYPLPGYVKIACSYDQQELNLLSKNNCEGPKPEPPPAAESCCDKIQAILDRLASILEKPKEECGARIGECCSKLDGCIDHIIDKINEKYKNVQKSCKQCQDEATTSVANTLEYAIACARYAGKRCDDEVKCTLADPTTEGKTCKGCGKDPCCCKEGVCKPCEDEDKQIYVGWCNRLTGVYVVLRKEEPQPGPDYIISNAGEDAALVLERTRVFCTQQQPPSTPPPVSMPELPTFNSLVCDYTKYASPAGIDYLLGNSTSINLGSALLQTSDQAAKALSEAVRGIPIASGIVEGTYGIAKMPFLLATGMTPAIASALGCNEQRWQSVYQALVAFGYVEKQLGVNLSEAKTPWRYAMNSLCPNKYTNIDQTLAAYFGNAIDYNSSITLGKMEGYCKQSIDWLIKVGRSKPIPLQLAVMRRREIISPSEYDAGMREIGYLEPKVRDNLFTLTEQVPPLTEIIRYMVRDADDEQLVNRFGLDAEFDDKYRKQLKKWSKDQGIPEQVARYSWRAHWQIPSPGQLFEFWHRLRYNPRFGGKEKLLEDIKAALVQQDILPYWHDAYLAVSFHPLTRVDARRAFELGALDKESLKASYIDQGYSDENADTLVRFNERRREMVAAKHAAVKLWQKGLITRGQAYERLTKDGLPGDVAIRALNDGEAGFVSSPMAQAFTKGDLNREEFLSELHSAGVSEESAQRIFESLSYKVVRSKALKQYEHGTITNGQAFAQAVGDGMHPAVANRLLSEVDRAIDDNLALACQKGIRRRFILGEYTTEQAVDKLVRGGITEERANKLAAAWQCEQSSIGKHIPAQTLCRYLSNGIIDAQEMRRRLINIGYSEVSAAMVIADCLISINAKRLKQAEKELKDNQAAEEKAQREAARQASAARAELERRQRAQDKASKTRLNREKLLLSAIEKVYKKCLCELATATNAVRAVKLTLEQERGFCTDDALQILNISAEGWEGGEIADYVTHVDIVASAGTAACGLSPEQADGSELASSGDTQPSSST